LLISVLLPAAIAVIMCSLGLTLVPADFGRVLSTPRGVLIGMLNLAVISPLLAFAVAGWLTGRQSWPWAWSCSALLPAG
jgi:BASS family bile acid:Na+ symporter